MNEAINVEGGNPLVGSGKLDGKGVPPNFFSDIHVRKAFNYCFDRDTYIKEVAHGEAIPHRGPVIADMPGYDAKSEVYNYDLDKCASEFTAAFNGDLAKNGFTITLAYNAGNDSRRIALELLRDGITAANAKMAGGDQNKQNFSVGIVAMAWPSYLAANRARSLPVNITGWIEDFHDPHNWVVPYISCTGTFSGRQGLPDSMCKPWDDLISQANVELDQAKAADMYAQLQKGAIDQAVDIFVEQPTGRHYEQLWLSGWYYNPLFGDPFFPAMSKTAPK
jgi:peptide/nickel transport system substrate-binding protein